MAGDDIQVRFGADTSKLQTAVKEAQSQLSDLASSSKSASVSTAASISQLNATVAAMSAALSKSQGTANDAVASLKTLAQACSTADVSMKSTGAASTSFSSDVASGMKTLEASFGSLAQVKGKVQDLLKSDNPLGSQLDAVDDKIKTLRAGLGAATGDATQLVKGFEGFTAKAKADSDGRYRAGYGSDTTTDAGGNVSSVTKDTVVTMEEAMRDLARRIPEFTALAAREIGDQFNNLSEKTKASLTSVAYNYGHVPNNIAAAARTGSDDAVAGAIADRADDNGGVNAKRRKAEATNITDNFSAAETAKINEDLATQLDLRQQIIDRQNGGNIVEKANQEIAARNVAGARDAVGDQEKINAALAQQLALTNEVGAKAALKLQLDEGTTASASKKIEVARAQAQLEVSALEDGSAKRRDILNAELAVEQAAYQKGSAQYLTIQKEIEDNDRTVKQAQQADAERTEESKYKIALNAIKERQILVKQEASEYLMTAQQESQAVAQNIQQQQSLLTQHYARLAEIYAGDVEKLKQIQLEKQNAVSQSALEQQRMVSDSQKKIQQDYMQTAQRASTSIGGILTGIITKHQSLRQSVSQILDQMLSKYVQFGAQELLLNMGVVGKDVATFLTGENLKTAAATSGAAAQAAAQQTASGGSMASTFGSIAKSISASASETFAGVFGFMAPIIGPAAAGPAAAAEATVLGHMPSFAVGAWSLPSDMIAQVHRGEMIVPAGPAAAMRNALSSGGSYSGGDVHVHHSTNFNVTAMDSQGVQKFFNNNGKHIMKAINSSVKSGAHLGLNRLYQA